MATTRPRLRRAGFLLALLSLLAAPFAATAQQPHPLTAEDVGSYFDGLLPWALTRGDLPGAVVTVVKDGQVLFARGYGFADVEKRVPVDPAKTLFRIGSISKLFTWTAVMQQVEQGKLDLDRDVNAYLDFKIPDAFGKPITLRTIMTHTAGFEEQVKDIFSTDASKMPALGELLRTHIPARVYAPGEVIAYSNYATVLAAYIVQRVSGEEFSDYADRHLFQPLGMQDSTFRQPLPKAIEAQMATGYQQASQPPQPFEVVVPFPAGSVSAPGTDMAKFMNAYLAHGASLLKPETAKQMAEINKPLGPGLSGFGMALGFFREDYNGRRVISHGGDTDAFHSYLSLLADDNVGIYVSFNGAGKEGATGALRLDLIRGFFDRYFPAPPADEPTLPTAREHGQQVAGPYINSRGGFKNWLSLAAALQPNKVMLDDDGTLTASGFVDAAGTPLKWREVQPYLWRQVGGKARLAVLRDKDGRVQQLATDFFPPVFVFLPAGFADNGTGALLVGFACAVLLATLLAWPLAALVRRHYRLAPRFEGRDRQLYRLSRLATLPPLLFVGGWLFALTKMMSDLGFAAGGSDPLLHVIQLIGFLGIAASAFLVWRAVLVFRDARFGWWGRVANVAPALAALIVVWAGFAYHLFAWGLHY